MEKDGVQYSVCHLFINGNHIGIYSQPVFEMYPLMWMAEGNKVIETNLTGENYSYPEGNQDLQNLLFIMLFKTKIKADICRKIAILFLKKV